MNFHVATPPSTLSPSTAPSPSAIVPHPASFSKGESNTVHEWLRTHLACKLGRTLARLNPLGLQAHPSSSELRQGWTQHCAWTTANTPGLQAWTNPSLRKTLANFGDGSSSYYLWGWRTHGNCSDFFNDELGNDSSSRANHASTRGLRASPVARTSGERAKANPLAWERNGWMEREDVGQSSDDHDSFSLCWFLMCWGRRWHCSRFIFLVLYKNEKIYIII